MKTTIYAGTIAALLFVFSGCGMAEPAPPVSYYTLNVPATIPQKKATSDVVLKVRVPKSPKYIATQEILYTKEEALFHSYAYSRWHDVPNEMIQKIMVSALSDSGLYKSAILSTSRIRADLSLESRIEKFVQQFEPDGKSHINVSFRLHLLDESDKKLISSQKFSYSQPTDTADAKGAVKAYNSILKRFVTEMTDWLSLQNGNLP